MWRDRDNFINLAQNLCVFFLFLIQLNDSVAFACFEYDLFTNWHSHIGVTFAANFYSTTSTIMNMYIVHVHVCTSADWTISFRSVFTTTCNFFFSLAFT